MCRVCCVTAYIYFNNNIYPSVDIHLVVRDIDVLSDSTMTISPFKVKSKMILYTNMLHQVSRECGVYYLRELNVWITY